MMAIPKSGKSSRSALIALAIASFGIGTTEFVIMGLLPDVARDLSVTIPRAGLLISGYALGVVFGAPILAVATARLERRRALLLLMGLFVIGNALCALAPSYSLLMGARIVTAFSHGAFFGLGSVAAAEIVPPEKRARAIALMFTGLALANVLGVPFGTALGQALGWRTTFWAVVGIGIIAVIALYAFVPRGSPPRAIGLMQEAPTLGRAQVLLAMLMSVFASASLFSVFTYITPMLEQVTRESPHQVTLVLLLLGLGLTVGNTIGGKLGDWRLMPAVIGTFIVLVVALTCFAIVDRSPSMTAVTIFVWGALAFALLSPLQMRVLNEASGAPNLASTLNQGAFNLGNAIGASAGELALTHGLQYADIPFLGAAFAATGLAFSVLALLLDRRAVASNGFEGRLVEPAHDRAA